MKFSGNVGYCFSEEGTGDREGIWEDVVREYPYFGDVLQNNQRWEQGMDVLDDRKTTNKISILADAFAFEHVSGLKYVYWMGTRWKVNSFELAYPRIILTLGGVYNGPTPGPSPVSQELLQK